MKPILLNIPMPIETPRLILRPPQFGDGAELNATIIESFDDLHPWMPWADKKPTLEDSEENIRVACAKWILREDLRIMIFDKETKKLVGNSGLHRMNWKLPSFEIGYWVRKSFTGKGYISESTNALTRFAFLHLNAKRVELRCDPENQKSTSIAKRLGFELEGHLKHDRIKPHTQSEFGDTLIFSRLNLTGLPELEVSWPK